MDQRGNSDPHWARRTWDKYWRLHKWWLKIWAPVNMDKKCKERRTRSENWGKSYCPFMIPNCIRSYSEHVRPIKKETQP
jgi:hypothetical protein